MYKGGIGYGDQKGETIKVKTNIFLQHFFFSIKVTFMSTFQQEKTIFTFISLVFKRLDTNISCRDNYRKF